VTESEFWFIGTCRARLTNRNEQKLVNNIKNITNKINKQLIQQKLIII